MPCHTTRSTVYNPKFKYYLERRTNEIFDVILLWARPVVSVHHLGRCLIDTEVARD